MSAPAIATKNADDRLLPRFAGTWEAGECLSACDRAIQEHLSRSQHEPSQQAPPALCWLRENHSYLQSQIREMRQSLSPAFIQRLLREAGQRSGDEPRTYRIAAVQVARSTEFGKADLDFLLPDLKENSSLSLFELWAHGAMLRLALLERLCTALDSELVVSSCVRTLRLLESLSWHELVESVSSVEEVLRQDPAGVYDGMDFETREQYRREVQKLSQRSGRTEREVAEAVLTAAQNAASSSGTEHVEAHVGYYLAGAGSTAFSVSLGCRAQLRGAVAQALRRWPGFLYATCFLIVGGLIVAAFDRFAGPLSWWMIAVLLIPASQAALEIVNSLVCHCLPPRPLPSMDYTNGVPDSCPTMVVVPALLLSPDVVSRLIEDLEIRYLANRDPNLMFALLTDFPDANEPKTEADSVLEACVDGIHRLNAQYRAGQQGPFFLFHRSRKWNAQESKWMGHERKRGKLNDLNKLILGRSNAFDVIIGDADRFRQTRYVITLDADTRLPRDTASKLVACMAHPLNRAVLDPITRTVKAGYGLIRPGVSVSMESVGRSMFAEIFSGMAGFDPYATVVSDIYQDFFGFTSFTGKGIYDVAAFDASVGDRFPDNAILSHDLIEGEHVRTGFLPGVELVEDYPGTYQAFCKRKHRWARGDWQLLPWLLSLFGNSGTRNRLGWLSRWKIFDNLRRSINEIAILLLFVAGWTSGNHTLRWTLSVLALLLLTTYVEAVVGLIRAPRAGLWRPFARNLGAQLFRKHRDILLNLAFLPHQAFLMADGISRTLFRRYITGRKLLEWETMAQSEAARSAGLGMVEIYFCVSSAASLLFLAVVRSVNPVMCFICELWIAAPLIAWWLNDPLPPAVAPSKGNLMFLRETALRTWRFFADHLDSENHWLIPDNVQQQPSLIARRVSPTNLGLSLTAHLAAHDFGYLSLDEVTASLRRILDSLGNMPRYKGHFYNWYDTETLIPLPPRYVSSVDSGNLAASLCTLRQGANALLEKPWLGAHTLAGLRDHALLIRNQLPPGLRSASLMRLLSSLIRQTECEPADLFHWEAVLSESRELIERVGESLTHTVIQHDGRCDEALQELDYWRRLLGQRIEAALSELYTLAPWLAPEFETELRVNSRDVSLAELMAEVSSVPALAELPQQYERIRARLLERLNGSEPLYPALRETLESLLQRLIQSEAAVLELVRGLESIASDAFRYFDELDFGFLFDRRRKLLRVGYDAGSGLADDACYDLLASEARTTVFLAIAKGQIPLEAWFRLGRKLTAYRNHRTLLSWSGTMFEYLMPMLHLRTYSNSLLDQALRGAIRIQRTHARERRMPWGVSEAAYSARDHLGQYQYRAFGVAPLSARTDRPAGVVVAPYAAILALMVEPAHATANLMRLKELGCVGRYGFFESIDYSAGTHPPEMIRCFMAHHQGMGLLAIDNALFRGRMQERFHLDPMVQATEFLLQERMPAVVDIPEAEARAAA